MMPGMTTHRRRIDWRAIGRTAGIVAVATTLGLFTLGLLAAAGVSSYDNLFHLAASRGVPIPHLSPLEIDAGLVVVIALDIVLTWLGYPIGGLRLLARILGIGTIAANVAAGWPDPVGASMRAFAPVIIVAVTEAFRAFLLRRHRDAAEEGIPFSRWMLAPWPTFILWRRMKLWDIHGYRAAVDMELSRRQAIVKLEMHFGGKWETAAPADLVWMLRAGVRMTEALERVAEITAPAPVPAPAAGKGSGRESQKTSRSRASSATGSGNRARKMQPAAAAVADRDEIEDAPEDLDSEAKVLWYLDRGVSASKAGVRAGLHDSRGRQIARLRREAPKGIDEGGSQ